MSQFFRIHPENPQLRRIDQAVEIVRGGGAIIYPTDSCYALGCQIGDKRAMERIRSIRRLDDKHHFTLVCRDLSQIAAYARVDNPAYRLLKSHTPGPYTFILRASREVPRRLLNPRRKTIGLRVPDHAITNLLLGRLGEALMSVTLVPPGEEIPMTEPEEIFARFGPVVDLVIDGGNCGLEPTTVVDLTDGRPVVLRRGRGYEGGFFET